MIKEDALLPDGINVFTGKMSVKKMTENPKVHNSGVPEVCSSVTINNWYAIRVPYGREMKLKAILDSIGVLNFIPMCTSRKIVGDKETKVMVPAISNLIFIKSTQELLNELKIRLEASVPFRYIMNRETRKPIIVPEKEMNSFIAVTRTMNEDLLYLTTINQTLANGSRVRVRGGVFNGIEGKIVRIKRDRRVMVALNSDIAVVTGFIKPELLERIEGSE